MVLQQTETKNNKEMDNLQNGRKYEPATYTTKD